MSTILKDLKQYTDLCQKISSIENLSVKDSNDILLELTNYDCTKNKLYHKLLKLAFYKILGTHDISDIDLKLIATFYKSYEKSGFFGYFENIYTDPEEAVEILNDEDDFYELLDFFWRRSYKNENLMIKTLDEVLEYTLYNGRDDYSDWSLELATSCSEDYELESSTKFFVNNNMIDLASYTFDKVMFFDIFKVNNELKEYLILNHPKKENQIEEIFQEKILRLNNSISKKFHITDRK